MGISTIHRVSQPSELLAAVPALVGCQPSESVVVIPFAGARTIGAMRFDLPSVPNAPYAATMAAGLVCKIPNATGLALVVYGERAEAEAIGDAISHTAATCGLSVLERLYVTSKGWGLIGGDVVSSMPEIPAHLQAMNPESDQYAGAQLPEVDIELARSVAEALPVDLPTALESLGTDPLTLLEVSLFEDLDAQSVAVLITLLNRPALRDIALVQWAHGCAAGEKALDAQIAWENGAAYPEHLAAVMWGEGPQPDAERLIAALTTSRLLAALAPERVQVGPLAAAAWLSWALGRSTHADIYARKALAIEPDHGLSQIVSTFVDAGHLPEFAFA